MKDHGDKSILAKNIETIRQGIDIIMILSSISHSKCAHRTLLTEKELQAYVEVSNSDQNISKYDTIKPSEIDGSFIMERHKFCILTLNVINDELRTYASGRIDDINTPFQCNAVENKIRE
ncbi:hypothetical protein Trydic_g8048 [Trypoxylus dichotomus]